MLAIILAVAAALRFSSIGAGIPYNIGVDEPEIMNRAVQMMKTGDFNPHFFDYPGFYIHAQLATACVRFIAGASRGQWRSLDQVDPSDFYLWGRALTALLGTLTVFIVYLIGLRWGGRHAALAAGLMAVMPLHVRESHYVLTDVPATFFVALTMLLSLRANERTRTLAFAAAGAAAGLAAATKYPGALALVMPLIAVWMTPGVQPSRIVALVAILGAALTAFLLAAPYTVLDLPAFLNGYARLAGHYTGPGPGEAPWITYFKHLRNAIGWPALLLLLTGVVMGVVRAVRGPGRVRWTLAIVFPLLFYYFISGQTLVFGRYLMPLVPFVSVLAAVGTVSGVSLLRRFDIPRTPRTAAIAALTAAALVPPAVQSVGFVAMLGRTGTIEQAYTWIVSNVPKGSSIVIETQALQLKPEAYAARNVTRLVMDYRGPGDYEEYVRAGITYVVASSQRYGDPLDKPHQFPDLYKAYMRLFEQSQELARFTPSAEHPGPEVRIYKIQ
jgi:hypothetical protein